MHKGRPYPYHWKFWATNFCFWPWFIGNRLVFDVPGAAGDDWEVLTLYPGVMLSDIGVVSADYRDVLYKFTPAEGGWFVEFELRSVPSPPGTPGEGRLRLTYLDGRVGVAWGPLDFGMTQPGEYSFTSILALGGFNNTHSAIRFNGEWATWSQGGGDPTPP